MEDKEIVIYLAKYAMCWDVRLTPTTGNTVAISDEVRVHLDGPNQMLRRWNPLESIADAWQALEQMGGMWVMPAENGHGWRCGKLSICEPVDGAGSYADEAPRAICLAIVSAIESDSAQ